MGMVRYACELTLLAEQNREKSSRMGSVIHAISSIKKKEEEKQESL